jgi:hypothetical protein
MRATAGSCYRRLLPAAGTAEEETMARRTIRWLAVVAGLTVLGCSDAGTPVEPSSTMAPQLSEAGVRNERHEELKQELEQRKAYFKEMKEANKDALKAAREEWKAWRRDWKEQYKLQKEAWKREHPGEKGGPDIQLLRCEPQDYKADAAIIGPEGGTLHVGDHELVIPAGALDREELVVAEAPTSSAVDVRFQPHGLQFRQPTRLTLSYKGCVRPTSTDFLIAYLGDHGNQILELPPSIDDKVDDEVEADIDHFSRYAIAW